MAVDPHPASFRDPDGFLFTREGVLLRQVNEGGRRDYDRLMGSGLYEHLVSAGLLVPHEEVDLDQAAAPGAWRILRPRPIPFVSHPWEWCFSQLRDAARLTLRVVRESLRFGMTTKDASAFNIQFADGRPLLIDTLSLTTYEEGTPWMGYRQFCQHFLAPLALMSLRDVRLGRLSQAHIDGIPLDLASALLPRRSLLRPSLLMHIHLHARSQARYASRTSMPKRRVGRLGFQGLIDNLESAVGSLVWQPARTEWGDYYGRTNYSPADAGEKQRLVADFLEQVRPAVVWDLGSNTGAFSRIAARAGAFTVSWDADPAAVEANYREVVTSGEGGILPLLLDLTNPSPGSGWANAERASLLDRGPADAVLALALVHHLAISNNVPLARVAEFFRRLGRHLIVEFVPKEDSQVRRLLATRLDVFPGYSREGFEGAFETRFEILRREPVGDSGRTLYLMTARGDAVLDRTAAKRENSTFGGSTARGTLPGGSADPGG